MNIHGNCPRCNTNWDGGDMLEELKKIDTFTGKTDAEILRFAKDYYGYLPESPKRFTKLALITSHYSGIIFLECPTCRAVWENKTFVEYKNIHDARSGKPREDTSDTHLPEEVGGLQSVRATDNSGQISTEL